MPLKPVPRKELISRVLDTGLHRKDREIAARGLVRNWPSVLPDVTALVAMCCPMLNPDFDVFNILADAFAEAHPKES